MKDLLLEIGTEEIPAGFMPSAIKELKDNAEKYLNEKRIQFNDIRTMGTPRRLILLVEGLADKQSDIEELVKGPAVKIAFDADGNPSKAGAGFARGQGVDPSQLIKKELDGVEYVYALKQLKGENVESIIPEFFVGMIQG
ncbi:MAG: glycine--tRNA ligase subunit beta, partial [Clostridia bacterium]|nr:glycine--tRNA ligase subunit beta [Clostridia bacterium]